MIFKELGKTGLKVSEIGLGTEYLFDQPKDVVESVILNAIENEINYFDVLFSVTNYIGKMASILRKYRDDIIITGHIGATELNSRPKRTRSIKESKIAFSRLLNLLKIDYVDIINIQFVKMNEYENMIKPGGLMELAISIQEEGKAKYLGLSTHDTSVAEQAIKTGKFDTIMFPINLVNHGLPGRSELMKNCNKNNIGLIAIKPFAAGRLLIQNRTVNFAKYQTGGISLKRKIPKELTSSQCINYVNSLNGVSVVLAGVKSVDELRENLKYSNPQERKRDFSSMIEFFQE